MKYKKFKKKLALSKKTVANLNTVEMTRLNGGGKLPCLSNCSNDGKR